MDDGRSIADIITVQIIKSWLSRVLLWMNYWSNPAPWIWIVLQRGFIPSRISFINLEGTALGLYTPRNQLFLIWIVLLMGFVPSGINFFQSESYSLWLLYPRKSAFPILNRTASWLYTSRNRLFLIWIVLLMGFVPSKINFSYSESYSPFLFHPRKSAFPILDRTASWLYTSRNRLFLF